jgi:hypothetical protein
MPHKNENKKPTRGNYLTTPTHTPTPTPTPTPAPAYSPQQQSTLWGSVKAGFGMSMGSRMFGFIFGDPTVKVEHKNLPPQPTSVYKEQNNCDTLREQIKFYKCDDNDKEERNTNRCHDLFSEYYRCQKNI